MEETTIPSQMIIYRRMSQQRLAQNPAQTPEEVTRWLGAVQAQEYGGAKWSLAMRMQAGRDGAIEEAFTRGAILRTHVLRPTWHFVTPEDISWLLELTGGRVKRKLGQNDRQLGIDSGLVAHSSKVFEKALQGGQHLTRAELGQELACAGIQSEGQHLGHLLMHAELDGVICSGARRGNQHTYALLEERAPQARRLERDAALAELARRYFTSHGPATLKDFAWWSGLTMADGKAGVESTGDELEKEDYNGQTCWSAADPLRQVEPVQSAFLLPTYDELLVGYSGFGRSRLGGTVDAEAFNMQARFMLGGRVAGGWRKSVRKGVALIEIIPFAPLAPGESEALEAAAGRYGEYLGLRVEVSTNFR